MAALTHDQFDVLTLMANCHEHHRPRYVEYPPEPPPEYLPPEAGGPSPGMEGIPPHPKLKDYLRGGEDPVISSVIEYNEDAKEANLEYQLAHAKAMGATFHPKPGRP